MRSIFTIAFRNILRNKKRTVITVSAVAMGLAAMIFLRGFVSGAQTQMVRNIVTTITSDAQIFPKSMENLYNTNGAIEDPEAVRRLLREEKRVLGYAEEVSGSGMVASATGSVMTFVTGLDPEDEKAIGSRFPLMSGRLMGPDEIHGAVLGEKMRKILGVELGDKVVVTVQDYSGSFSGEAFTLVGTMETGNDQLDNGNVILLREPAKKLLGFGHRISRFCLKIDPRYPVAQVVRDLRERLSGTDLKVMTWEELIPMLAQMVRFQDGMIFVVLFIVLIVVTAGMLNTLLMSVIERVREFGLMMSLGTRPSRVVGLVFCESFLLAVMGLIAGVLLGLGPVYYFGRVGVDLSRFTSAFSNFLIGSHVYPRADWFWFSLFGLIVLMANLLASLYPAWRAGRLVPIDAMREVG